MNSIIVTCLGLFLIIVSQLLLSFGYDFLMSQRPIDFAHWSLLIAALSLFGLWYSLPQNATKKIGLIIMTLGIGGIVGMCLIDFLLWAAHGDRELKENIFNLISNTSSIKLPFLVLGPSFFYGGICISTYGLFNKYKWQVVILNLGGLMIGLGHMVLGNQVIPVIGATLLFTGLTSILLSYKDQHT